MNIPDQPPTLPGAGGPPSPAEIKEYAAFMRPHSMHADAAATALSNRLEELRIYESLVNSFGDGSDWAERVETGSYPALKEYAQQTSSDIVKEYEHVWTLPRAFGTHALASLVAPIMGPDERVAHREDRTAFFLTHFARGLALALPRHVVFGDTSPNKYARAVDRHPVTDAVTQRARLGVGYLHIKLRMLGEAMVMRRHITGIIDREPRFEIDDAQELRSQNNILFDQLQRLRYNTIKSATHVGKNSTWSIHDTYGSQLQRMRIAEEAGAAHHLDRWSPMVMEAIQQPPEDTNLRSTEFSVDNDDRSGDDLYYFGHRIFMDNKGELFVDAEGAMPLWDFYKAAGKPVNYEALRQFLLQKYFDLTVPLTIVREAVESTKAMLGTRDPDADREQGRVQYDLLLPRIRVLTRYRRPEDLEEVERREVQPYAFSRVGGRVRLPEGYNTSDEARRFAAKADIELRDGETYRRPYVPDESIARPVVHRAKYRKKPSPNSEQRDIPESDSK
ncbi:MAG: hypothetical protein ABWX94_01835 [Candidatus Saccharimonadales bacterium]